MVKNSDGTGPLTGITQIAAGGLSTCARLDDGTARCWGLNSSGQLGDGTTTNRQLPVVVKNPTGTVLALTAVTDVTTAVVFSCARMNDGTALVGGNGAGVLGDGTTTAGCCPSWSRTPPAPAWLTGVTQVSVRCIHSCVRMNDGTAGCWGYNGGGRLGDGTTTTSGCCPS